MSIEIRHLLPHIVLIRYTLEKVKLRSTKRFVTSQVISKLKYHWYIKRTKYRKNLFYIFDCML